MAAVWNYCKGKTVCEADDVKEDVEGAEHVEEPKKGHGGCGHIQPQIRKEGLKLFLQYKKSKNDDDEEFKAAQPEKRLFTPAEVYNVLKKISDDDIALLGLSEEYARPDWMILTVMPVPPPPVRPSVSSDGGALRSEDDLTYKLGDIIKASANVQRCEEEGAPAHIINEFEQLLQVSRKWRDTDFIRHANARHLAVSSTLPRTSTTILLVFRQRCRSLGGLSRPFVHG